MASYDMEMSPQPQANNADEKKISFRFCRECSNMLYPKEDRETNQLLFACRTCHFSEPATASCIYRNSLKEEIAETAGNVEDVAQDPTVGDSELHNDENQSMAYGEDDLMVHEFCTICGQDILCPFCGLPTDAAVTLEVADPEHDAGEDEVEAERRERALSGATFQGS